MCERQEFRLARLEELARQVAFDLGRIADELTKINQKNEKEE